MELIKNKGCLFNYLQDEVLDIYQKLKIFMSIVLAVKDLHKSGYCHSDLKPENITYFYDTKENKKCMDHCHLTGLFRNILCNSCNSKRREKENSSGTTNITWCNIKNSWKYRIVINKKLYQKQSKDLEWLKNYKKEYENKYLYNI